MPSSTRSARQIRPKAARRGTGREAQDHGPGTASTRTATRAVPTMKAALDTLIVEYDRPDLLALYDALEKAMTEKKGILPNLDYPSGPPTTSSASTPRCSRCCSPPESRAGRRTS